MNHHNQSPWHQAKRHRGRDLFPRAGVEPVARVLQVLAVQGKGELGPPRGEGVTAVEREVDLLVCL